jgi:hypothetical protein
MTKIDKAALVALLESIEAGSAEDHPVAQWLAAEPGAPDELPLDSALLAVEAARLMGLGAHLQAAKKSADKRVKKAAGKAIHVLKSTGQSVPDAPSESAGWSLSREQRELPQPVGLLGLPQSDGYFPFILVAHSEDGACVCAGVAGAGQGYQDADHGHVGRSQARDIIASAQGDRNLHELPFHVALSLCERAFSEGGRGAPHGWSHMLDSVPEATRSSARLLDPMQRQATKLDRTALAQVDCLTEGDGRVVFGLDEKASGPAIEACIAALTSQVEVDNDDKRRRIAGVVKQATTAALTGHARQTWELTMDVIAVIGESSQNQALQAAARHTSLALADGLDGSDIPFFRIWVERQLAAVSELVMSTRSAKE